MLEPCGERQARLQGDPPLPPEEEPRLLAQVKRGGRQNAGGRLRRTAQEAQEAQEDGSGGSGGRLRRLRRTAQEVQKDGQGSKELKP